MATEDLSNAPDRGADNDRVRQVSKGDSPFFSIGLGLFFVLDAAYLFTHPESFRNSRPIVPWMIGAAGIMGLGFFIAGLMMLYAVRAHGLSRRAADDWVVEKASTAFVGLIKWGLIAAAALVAYNFMSGPFASLDLGTKVIAGLLAVIACLLLALLHNTDKIINRLNR